MNNVKQRILTQEIQYIKDKINILESALKKDIHTKQRTILKKYNRLKLLEIELEDIEQNNKNGVKRI